MFRHQLAILVQRMSQTQLAVYYVTAASPEQGQAIAKGLLEARLAACCNVLDGVTSTYVWQGAICSDKEVLLVIKSRLSLLPQIEAKVKELHSYDVP